MTDFRKANSIISALRISFSSPVPQYTFCQTDFMTKSGSKAHFCTLCSSFVSFYSKGGLKSNPLPSYH